MAVVEHRIDSCHGGDAYRSRWQTLVAVGVVGVVDAQHTVVYASCLKLPCCEFHRRVGLKQHTLLQSVDIHSCHRGHFFLVGSLFGHYAGKGHHLQGAQSGCAGFLAPLGSPEALALFLHTVEEAACRRVPVNVVGVGYEHSYDVVGSVAILAANVLVAQQAQQFVAAEHQLARHHAGQLLSGAHRAYGNAHGCLHTVAHTAERHQRSRRPHLVAACLDVGGIAAYAGEHLERRHAVGRAQRSQLGADGVHVVVVVNVDILPLALASHAAKEQVAQCQTCCRNQH